ncbi:MAG: SGNH/GDSL hydrolase family protein [Acidimicrobiales bacterium]
MPKAVLAFFSHHVIASVLAGLVVVAGVSVGVVAATSSPASAPLAFEPYPMSGWYALGDSYISGEGTGEYTSRTDQNGDYCHRSPQSYVSMLGVPENDFFACSGATISQIEHGRNGEPPQVPRVPPSARVILLSAGGDSFGFASVLTACVSLVGHSTSYSGCQSAVTSAENAIPNVKYQLTRLINQLHHQAPQAWIVLVGYPELFQQNPTSSCSFISAGRQLLLNEAATQLNNNYAQPVVNQLSASGVPVWYVDTLHSFAGHELCDSNQYLNPLIIKVTTLFCHPAYTFGPSWLTNAVCVESFHPNAGGYSHLLSVVRASLQQLCQLHCPSGVKYPPPPPPPPTAPPPTAPPPTAPPPTAPPPTAPPPTAPPPTAPSVKGFAPGTPQPGHSSPQAAAVGFIQAALESDWGVACSYGLPDQQSLCTLGTLITGFTATGDLQLGNTVVNGSQAIVASTGSVCITVNGTSQCGSNADPNAGLPGSGLSFAEAYAEELASPSSPSSPGFWATACDEVGGQWYVDFGS